jgi:NAD(P)-dependent dehydrogenase (short-subunit alcohol dehydrogenase family)
MQGKICLLTGATRGIGRAVASSLVERGATLLLHCRTRMSGEQVRAALLQECPGANIQLYAADLSEQREVRRLAADITASQPRIDVLINNAAAFFMRRTMTPDHIEATFAVNYLAPFMLTLLLVERLVQSTPARIVNVASEAHQRVLRPENWQSEGWYGGVMAYGRSKLADVMFTFELADRLVGSGVTVNCCHPGVINTQLLAAGFERWWLRWLWPAVRRRTGTVTDGARTIVYLASSPEVEGVSGRYYKHCQPAAASRLAHDRNMRARLWALSLRLAGEPPLPVPGDSNRSPGKPADAT